MKTRITPVFILSSLLLAPIAFAQSEGHLKLVTVVQKEAVTVDASGREVRELVPADTVVPGDFVVYTITFENTSVEVADNVTITNPVPENLTYQANSAFGPGAEILFSVDGGSEYGAPAELFVTENGVRRAATSEDFTHIRWILRQELEPGAQGIASFRARLN